MEMGAFLYFRISGNSLNWSLIAKNLPVEPQDVRRKGEVTHSKISGDHTVSEDVWMAEYKIREDQTLDEALLDFLPRFIDGGAYLNQLARENNVMIWCSLYPEVEQFNLHLSSEALKLIAQTGAAIEITYAYLKELYEGTTPRRV